MLPIEQEELLELIGLIYDCALDPTLWAGTMDRINAACGFMASILALQALPSGEYITSVMTGYGEPWRAVVGHYTGEIICMWGGPHRINGFPVDEPLIHSRVDGLPDPRKTRYYEEWLWPQGIVDAMAVCIVRDVTSVGSIAFSRHVDAGPLGEREIEAVRILAPHIRRSLSISRLLDQKAVKVELAERLFDEITTGVVFVDENLQVTGANAAAHELLANGQLISSQRGRFSLNDPAEATRLQKILVQAATDGGSLAHRGIAVPVCGKDGQHYLLHVLPLSGGNLRPHLRKDSKAAIFITGENAKKPVAHEALGQIYDLTPTEARVLEGIAAGKTIAAIADEFSVAQSTIKTHLHSVFSKTGCSRQSDIVRLANSFSLVL